MNMAGLLKESYHHLKYLMIGQSGIQTGNFIEMVLQQLNSQMVVNAGINTENFADLMGLLLKCCVDIRNGI